jgi:hypothetical protein
MTSDTVSNGNILMKEIILNFNNQTWSLKVRGTEIDLEKLSISNHFDSSTSLLSFITLLHLLIFGKSLWNTLNRELSAIGDIAWSPRS